MGEAMTGVLASDEAPDAGSAGHATPSPRGVAPDDGSELAGLAAAA